MVVTAPTNDADGIIPAVLHYFVKHEEATQEQVFTFSFTAAAIGGIIKHNSSISGAEVGCQGEVSFCCGNGYGCTVCSQRREP